MKLAARIHRGTSVIDHQVEVVPHQAFNGVRQFRFGDEVVEVHCEEITPGVYSFLINGRSYEATVAKPPGGPSERAGVHLVTVGLRQYRVELVDPRQWRRTASAIALEGPQEIVAPMPGKIVKVLVTEGQQVEQDQGLLVIEAMKMQNEVRSPRAGWVERIYAAEGCGVESSARLLRLA